MKIEKEFLIFLNGFLVETELTRRAAYKTARPARVQRPLGTLERTEPATVAHTHRAASTVWPVVSGYGMNHDKVLTMSTLGAWRTCITWSRAPTRSEEGG
jgi:hypothetical protein